MSPIQFSHIKTESESQPDHVVVFIPGKGLQPPVASDHPSYKAILGACMASMKGESVDEAELIDLFDIGATITRKFQRLSDRVTVKGDNVLLDGDPVHGTLQEQILDFLSAGEDFGPLVNFYEKLLTNPLGDVRDGLYDWIDGGRKDGPLTITPEGNILGYKSVHSATPEWRTDETTVYRPSRRGEGIVNGRDVTASEFIEQVAGDVVEMPRSKVLNAPSQACGDGLHIGTWGYANGFQGDTVMLVEFSPRDIVSLPDSNSAWKLRVCRYTVIRPVDEPLSVPVYQTREQVTEESRVGIDLSFDSLDDEFEVGDRVEDDDGDQGTVVDFDSEGDPVVEYDNENFGVEPVYSYQLAKIHGKGGPTSQATKGNGRNPAQDDKGRFSNGRPGSSRDASTGRFSG
jgi:hypothetical protein